MADFCKQCSMEHFGKDFKELAGLSTEADDLEENFVPTICEGCGHTLVNSKGECVDNCAEWHKSERIS